MYTNYSVPRLTSETPDSTREKLAQALRAVSGVEAVTLRPVTHQLEIKGDDGNEPNRADISAAALKVGFEIEVAS